MCEYSIFLDLHCVGDCYWTVSSLQSHEYFINERGSLIHVRSYLPGDARSIRAVVFFSHG